MGSGAVEPTLDKRGSERIVAAYAQLADPKMHALKNCCKNETQEKDSAMETYEEQLALAVKQKKMTEQKK